jgi:hypothetical protein
MDYRDSDRRSGDVAGDNGRPHSCPKCASEIVRLIVILDTRKGKPVRLFRCRCGELIWDD